MKVTIISLSLSLLMATGSLFAEGNMLSSSEILQKNGWNFWGDKGDMAAGVKTAFTEGKFIIEIPAATKPSPPNLQLMKDITLKEGNSYELTFTATAAQKAIVRVSYVHAQPPWECYFISKVELAPGTAEYKCVITPQKANGKYDKPFSMRFFLGNNPDNKITLEKVTIVEVK